MTDVVNVRTIEGIVVPDAGTYEIDPAHSTVEFTVRHLGLAKVRGRFNEFNGVVEIASDPFESSAWATIQAATIDTRNSDRDAHLRSPDFLDAEHHPTIDFSSTGVQQTTDGWSVTGELIVRGTTRPVTLATEFDGAAVDPWGNVRIGLSAVTEINREDFGLTWNQALEAGGWLVGKQVKLEISVEAVRNQQ
ncbi:MAG: YceI family protein [Actinobacteria bacterium]|nr:YceI family protein [Actinomycetota bacterium]